MRRNNDDDDESSGLGKEEAKNSLLPDKVERRDGTFDCGSGLL